MKNSIVEQLQIKANKQNLVDGMVIRGRSPHDPIETLPVNKCSKGIITLDASNVNRSQISEITYKVFKKETGVMEVSFKVIGMDGTTPVKNKATLGKMAVKKGLLKLQKHNKLKDAIRDDLTLNQSILGRNMRGLFTDTLVKKGSKSGQVANGNVHANYGRYATYNNSPRAKHDVSFLRDHFIVVAMFEDENNEKHLSMTLGNEHFQTELGAIRDIETGYIYQGTIEVNKGTTPFEIKQLQQEEQQQAVAQQNTNGASVQYVQGLERNQDDAFNMIAQLQSDMRTLINEVEKLKAQTPEAKAITAKQEAKEVQQRAEQEEYNKHLVESLNQSSRDDDQSKIVPEPVPKLTDDELEMVNILKNAASPSKAFELPVDEQISMSDMIQNSAEIAKVYNDLDPVKPEIKAMSESEKRKAMLENFKKNNAKHLKAADQRFNIAVAKQAKKKKITEKLSDNGILMYDGNSA